ncbi:MAG: DNA-directed RNA polymerase subunit beta', partial [Patescibacteria group bacterium]|nr:DNA-directed RNA polymerase subunit beta' [Patescibacteria group bacterium]
AAYIITKIDEQAKKEILDELQAELKQKTTEINSSAASQKEKKSRLEELKKIFISRKEEIVGLDVLRVLSESEFREFSLKYGEIFEAGTGAEVLKEIFKLADLEKEIKSLREKVVGLTGLKRKKVLARLRMFEGLQRSKSRPEWMLFDVLPVLPPDLRPMVQLDGGRYASSDLNDLYRRVINRNNRLKYLLEISAPDVIVRNEKRMLQEAGILGFLTKMRRSQVVTTATTGGKRVLKSLADILSGKQGRFRKNLLGKRVDYSGRSVIVPGPELKLFECGLPKIMALELFRPFVIKKLLERELAYNIRGAVRLIEEGIDEVWASLEEVVEGKLVLLNRAPTLHRLGIQAFEPRLIEGEAIKLHPMVCSAFNADFDGDQMAVHVPLSDLAQKEARDLMLSAKNLFKPADGLPVVVPTKDITLGCYFVTGVDEGGKGENKVFGSEEEVIMAYQLGELDLRAKIKLAGEKGKLLETTCGRLIFNRVLPQGFDFVNEQMNSKKMSRMINRVLEKYSLQDAQRMLDNIKEVGFEFSTLSSISWGMDDLVVPKEKAALMEQAEKESVKIESHYENGFLSAKEKSAKLIEIWQVVKEKIEKLVPEALPKNGSVFSIIDSGARGSWAQPVQMAGMKGLVTSPTGRIIEMPVKHSFKEGFDVLEYFISTHGARKGTSDTALRTSASGYLTRRLVDVAHEVIIDEKDCGDKQGLEVLRSEAKEAGQDFRFKIVGRVAAADVNDPKTKKNIVETGQVISWDQAKIIDDMEIPSLRVFSPLSCKNLRRLCQKCYGWDMGRSSLVAIGEAVGVVAAQSIGEPGTQLTMRTFHTGGVSSVGDITRGLPRIEEIFESRIPKGEAVMSLSEGRVKEVDLSAGRIVVEVSGKAKSKSKKGDVLEYKIPLETEVYVKKGDLVSSGQPLCQGSLDLKKYFKLTGPLNSQRHILKEIQKIYSAEGINIHDKHVEIIVRQMFSRARVSDAGDGPWVPGQIISQAELFEVNQELKKTGKNLAKAKPIILGVSRVALTSDSFLSAASFQETSRVLIRASLEGREDKLHGLKENVIIGRLIPAGTGFRE